MGYNSKLWPGWHSHSHTHSDTHAQKVWAINKNRSNAASWAERADTCLTLAQAPCLLSLSHSPQPIPSTVHTIHNPHHAQPTFSLRSPCSLSFQLLFLCLCWYVYVFFNAHHYHSVCVLNRRSGIERRQTYKERERERGWLSTAFAYPPHALSISLSRMHSK